jgi:hypothetical protein
MNLRYTVSELLLAALATTAIASAQNQVPANPPPDMSLLGGILVVSTDSACKVSLDSENGTNIAAKETKHFTVSAGSHIVVCTSTEQPTVTQRKAMDVVRREEQSVAFELRPGILAEQNRDVAGIWKYKDQEPVRTGRISHVCTITLQIMERAEEGNWSAQCIGSWKDGWGPTYRRTILYQTTFNLTRSGQIITGTSSSMQSADSGENNTQNMGPFQLTCTLSSPGNLNCILSSEWFKGTKTSVGSIARSDVVIMKKQ